MHMMGIAESHVNIANPVLPLSSYGKLLLKQYIYNQIHFTKFRFSLECWQNEEKR